MLGICARLSSPHQKILTSYLLLKKYYSSKKSHILKNYGLERQYSKTDICLSMSIFDIISDLPNTIRSDP